MRSADEQPSEQHVQQIALRLFGREAETIARLSDDPMHAVFEVNVGSEEVVVAIAPSTSARFIAGSVYWNPLLASQGILVPRLLYSYLPESAGAFAYTVSERLSGRSVEDCYDGLGDAQRGALAHEVATAQREVGRLPAGRGFGFAFSHDEFLYVPTPSWPDFLEARFREFAHALKGISALPEAHAQRAMATLEAMKGYLEAIAPEPFLDEVTDRNVLVEAGKLSGIVQVDTVCFGDRLYAVGNTLFRLLSHGRSTDYADRLSRAFGVQARSPEAGAIRLYALYKCLGQMARMGTTATSGLTTVCERLLEG